MGDLAISALCFLGIVVVGGLIAAYMESKMNNQHTPPSSKLDRDRLKANIRILQKLVEYTAQNPSQRFGQILRNVGILEDVVVKEQGLPEWEEGSIYIDRRLIHEEPWVTLEKIEKILDNVRQMR